VQSDETKSAMPADLNERVRSLMLNFYSFAAIADSRATSWKGIDTRKHTLRKLYQAVDRSDEFVVLGNMQLRRKNGWTMQMRFRATVIVEQGW